MASTPDDGYTESNRHADTRPLLLDEAALIRTLTELKAQRLGVATAAIHIESTESNAVWQFKVADVRRRTGSSDD
jgi:hypothetical protein